MPVFRDIVQKVWKRLIKDDMIEFIKEIRKNQCFLKKIGEKRRSLNMPKRRLSNMADRPHSRKVKVAEGTAEVKKGEKVGNTPAAGSGGAPLGGMKEEAGKEEKENS